jgi:hypothetical protein
MLVCLQLLRWSDKGPEETPTIDVTISSKQQLNGLLAALAVLYHNEDLFKQLPQQDLVSAVVYGDQLAIPRAVELGMQLLQEAAGGINQECCMALAAVPTWPTCLLPLVPLVAAQYNTQGTGEQQQVYYAVLVSALGDLEAVWEDEQLQEQLLALPLPAAELLLSSPDLRVVSEDTVLYTAIRYVEHLDSIQGREAAKEALSKCIRCVRLSQRNLLALAVDSNSPLLSKGQQELVMKLLSLCLVSTQHCVAELTGSLVCQVPAAWLLPHRTCLVPASAKSLVWRVEVADIKAVCRAAAARTGKTELLSGMLTGPVCGQAFGLFVQAQLKGNPSGTCVGVFIKTDYLPGPCVNLNLAVAAVGTSIKKTMTSMLSAAIGWPSFFDVPPMGGDGWDEAAWAAKGLPVEGHIELQLTVEQL